MGAIKIGTCGFEYYRPPEGWKNRYKSKLQAYSDVFRVVEINRTFYKLPMLQTTRRWHGEVSQGFEFTLKAWQAITHPTSSPTWRQRTDRLTEKQKSNFGCFRPNKEVLEAWNETKIHAEALSAKVCVLQTPPKFACSKKNEENLRQFAEKIDRGTLELAWEPRGNWLKKPERVRDICKDLNLIHIVDLMRRRPVSLHPIIYTRLHGLNSYEYDYNYDYSTEELKQLAAKIRKLADTHETVYCMFNNNEMFANARKLSELLDEA